MVRSFSDACAASLILFNGRILTVDRDFSVEEAIAVKDERILAIGSDEEVLNFKGVNTEVVDLGGMMVLPGLCDSHLHMINTGIAMKIIDCRSPPVRSIGDIVAAVKDEVGRTEPGEWIVGRGWDQSKLVEGRYPDRWDLDEVSPDNPVILTRTCGHLCLVNSKALELACIDMDSRQPEGGRILKNEEGEPTGILAERPATYLVKSIIPPDTMEVKMEAIKAASEAFAAAGITSVVEAGVNAEDMVAYQRVLALGDLKVRVNFMLNAVQGTESIEESSERIENFPLASGFGNEMLKFHGLKLFLDGGIGGRTALLREPYEGEPDNVGVSILSEEDLQRLVDTGNVRNMQIGVHAAGGRAMDLALKAFENTNKLKPIGDRRFYMIHAYRPSEENFEQCRRLGVAIASQPSFIYYLGDSFQQNVGEERSSWVKPHRTWLDKGLEVAGGTDSPVTPFSPFPSIWASIRRKTELGRDMGEEQRITRQEAIKLYTFNGAYLTFEENIKGSLEPGKLADMIVVDRDFLKCHEDEIKDTKVTRTILSGRTVFQDGSN
jgi:predicted amidohydrolase YtcJ